MVTRKRSQMLGMLLPEGNGASIFLQKPVLIVGRRPSCDIHLDFADVSSQHCEMTFVKGCWRLRDLKSKNGVKVNGARIDDKIVKSGDMIAFGKQKFTIKFSADGKTEYVPETKTESPPETKTEYFPQSNTKYPDSRVKYPPDNKTATVKEERPLVHSQLEKRGLVGADAQPRRPIQPVKVETLKIPSSGVDDDEDDEPVILVLEKSDAAPPAKRDTITDDNRLGVTVIEGMGAPAAAARYAVGTLFGKYVIKGFLGQGGMGVVYRGFDPMIERDLP